MFRLALIFITLITFGSAKSILSNFEDNNLDVESDSKLFLTSFRNSDNEDKIWVLELNDEGFEALKLREANEEDVEDWEFYTEPVVKAYKREHTGDVKLPKRAQADEDKKKEDSKKSVSKEDIFKYLNKFALYSKSESDGYLFDSHENDDPSIALHFRGRFTALIVKQGMRQWHYFIEPTSFIPAWFYEDLTSKAKEGIITVPKDITDSFYPVLFRILQILLRYPV